MSLCLTVSEHDVAMAIYNGDLSLQEIVRTLAAERIDEEETLLNEIADIGTSLAKANWSRRLHPFAGALEALANDHHEQLLKGDIA